MSTQTSQLDRVVARRSELMAELFLQNLNPLSIMAPAFGANVGYDFLVTFANSKNGINTVAIAVKSTQSIQSNAITLSRKEYERLAYSNLPSLLLVTDVKHNQIYYTWPNKTHLKSKSAKVPLELTQATQESIKQLRETLVA